MLEEQREVGAVLARLSHTMTNPSVPWLRDNRVPAVVAAVIDNDLPAIRVLLQFENGSAYPVDECFGIDGLNALHVAARDGCEICMVILLSFGASACVLNSRGRSAAWLAAGAGQASCLLLLLDAGCDQEGRSSGVLKTMSLTDSEGRSPALVAATYGRTDCIRLLIEARVDMVTPCCGLTPFQAAEKFGHRDTSEVIQTYIMKPWSALRASSSLSAWTG
jgi:ankyrin repeat protein